MKAIHIRRVVPIAMAVVARAAASATYGSLQVPAQPPAAVLQTMVMIAGEFANGPTAGAGLVFGGDRKRFFIVTADHVVRRRSGEVASNLEVRFRSQRASPLPARFTGHADTSLDIAVLEVQGLDEHALSFCQQPFGWFAASRTFPVRVGADGQLYELRRGTAVYPVGHPNGVGWAMPVTADRIVEVSGDSIVFQSVFIGEGHSGGALITEHGEIVGLIQAHEPPFGRARHMVTVLDALRSWGYPVAARWPGEAYRAVDIGDVEELRRLLMAGGCTVFQDRGRLGGNLLELAVFRDRPAVVALLLEHGADVAQGRNGRTPVLSLAAVWNHAEIVTLLLEAGADVNQPDDIGRTPLFSASAARSAEIVRRLLAAGADVNRADSDGETALFYALRRYEVENVRLLLAAGANVNVRSRSGVSPLSLVRDRRTREEKELYKLLIEKGAVR